MPTKKRAHRPETATVRPCPSPPGVRPLVTVAQYNGVEFCDASGPAMFDAHVRPFLLTRPATPADDTAPVTLLLDGLVIVNVQVVMPLTREPHCLFGLKARMVRMTLRDVLSFDGVTMRPAG